MAGGGAGDGNNVRYVDIILVVERYLGCARRRLVCYTVRRGFLLDRRREVRDGLFCAATSANTGKGRCRAFFIVRPFPRGVAPVVPQRGAINAHGIGFAVVRFFVECDCSVVFDELIGSAGGGADLRPRRLGVGYGLRILLAARAGKAGSGGAAVRREGPFRRAVGVSQRGTGLLDRSRPALVCFPVKGDRALIIDDFIRCTARGSDQFLFGIIIRYDVLISARAGKRRNGGGLSDGKSIFVRFCGIECHDP